MENYKITGRAGEGAHGCVFQGMELASSKVVALKKININVDLGIPKNLMREICSLRALKHKNIVKIFDVTSMGSSVVLVMEFLPCSLQQILKNTQLSLAQIKTYSKMLLSGVRFMHKSHIMHRDIKPANLLISPKGCLKIGDFGLARLFNADPSRQYSHQVATRWYRAPELLYGSKTYTPAIDMWSVGCIIAEMINGTPLFPGESDIGQLAIVLSTLGTPTEETWPDLKQLPDYNKISFISSSGKRWRLILPTADHATLDLMRQILIYDGQKRFTAQQALSHQFFIEDPKPATLKDLPDPKGCLRSERPSYNPQEFDEIIEQINKIS
ncbi:hypothetical protein HUJ05_012571 [Dendroctonus ponderosae]|nr:hypothetical protein HUJ05_012571 [Dendroctonus ponderosae]